MAQTPKSKGSMKVIHPGLLLIFLGLLGFASLTQDVVAGSYSDSAHGQNINRSAIDPTFTQYATGNCAHCHKAHGSLTGANPALRFSPVGQLCISCHNGSVAPNIAGEFEKTYSHTAGVDTADRHTMSVDEAGLDGAPFRGNRRHDQCVDCHNPHTAQKGLHSFNTANPALNNDASPVLAGAWGVKPTVYPGNWQVPTNFTEVNPVEKEYQLCFKCHSYYALQDPDGITNIVGPSGSLITDQAWELNPNNAAFHPVVVGLSDSSSNSQALSNILRLKPPWNTPGNLGVQTMYCTDCHGSEVVVAGIYGPHGSTNRFMLHGGDGATPIKSWPYQPDNPGSLWALPDGLDDPRLFCNRCHTLNRVDTADRSLNRIHTTRKHDGADCVECHSTLTHGFYRKRFIVLRGDPAPYNYGGNSAVITRFDFLADGDYRKNNCATSGCSIGDH